MLDNIRPEDCLADSLGAVDLEGLGCLRIQQQGLQQQLWD